MPTVQEQKDAALVELERLVQPDATPTLDDTELGQILDAAQRASFWIGSTAFSYGAVLMPTVRNGHRYICLQGGVSGSTEPVWPTRNSAVISDGGVKWKEAGADFDNVFDVRAAAQEAWRVKLAKASQLFDAGNDKVSQITEHCREMASSFGAIRLA